MMVDQIGDVLITNDGATILANLEVQHPAAKVLVELAHLQDVEVGDGTTSVVLIAAELLRRGNQLIQNKVHPTTVISGFRMALKESVEFIKNNLIIKKDDITDEVLTAVARTSMSSKLIGPESAFFSKIAVQAISRTKYVSQGVDKYSVKNINIQKIHGKSSLESELVDGYAVMTMRGAQGMPIEIKKARVACLDMSLNKFRLQMGVQVLLNDPKQIEEIRKKEMDVTKERCNLLIKAGANVIVCTKGIDEFAIKYFVEQGCIAIRRVDKGELRRIAKSTGAKVMLSFADEEGEESIDPSLLGSCESVNEERVGDYDFIFFRGCHEARSQTILLRGANDFMLDEMERSIHDSLCAVKRVLESKSCVVGGGAVEAAVSVHLENKAAKMGVKEMLAISEFSEALMCIPKILANNAAKDAIDLAAKLRAFHKKCIDGTGEDKFKYAGLDLIEGKVVNNYERGVFEPAVSKLKSLKFATEAAITILRIDDLIKIAPKEEDMEG